MTVQKQPLDCARLPLPDYGYVAVAAFLIKKKLLVTQIVGIVKATGPAVIHAGEAVIYAIA